MHETDDVYTTSCGILQRVTKWTVSVRIILPAVVYFHRGTKWTISTLPAVVFFHRDTKWTVSILPAVVFFTEAQSCCVIFVSQMYKVDNVYTACCSICFTEVQNGQCLYCLLWYLFHRGTKWTISILPAMVFVSLSILPAMVFEVQSGQCLCGIFSQRYKVDNVCTACCDICFTEVQSGQYLYCLLWYLFHRGTKWTVSMLPVVVFVS